MKLDGKSAYLIGNHNNIVIFKFNQKGFNPLSNKYGLKK